MTMFPNCSLSLSNFSLSPALLRASSETWSLSSPKSRSQLFWAALFCKSVISLGKTPTQHLKFARWVYKTRVQRVLSTYLISVILFRLGQFSMRFSIENIDNSAFKLSFNEKVWRYFNEFLLRISIMSSSAKEIDLPSSKCFRDGHLVTNFLKRISCLLNSLQYRESSVRTHFA